jgi:hypothetical protein
MPIFRFNDSSQLFEQVPGELRDIRVNVSDIGIERVWGLGRDSEIFRWVGPPGQFFNQVPGRLASIAPHVTAGPEEEEVWGLDAENNIFRFHESTGTFLPIPGKLKVIANAGRGNVWGLSPNSDIFRFNEDLGVFEKIPGKLTSIATIGSSFGLGANSTAIGINQNSDVFWYNEVTQLFEQKPGKLLSISAKGNQIWGLNVHSEIFEISVGQLGPEGSRPRFSVSQVPGKLTRISVDWDEAVWGLHQTKIFRWNVNTPQHFEQVRDENDRKLTRISVGASDPGSTPNLGPLNVSVWGLFNLSQKSVPIEVSKFSNNRG